VQELGGGVHRVTLPLPWALDHVHCYAVDDAEGWTLIDCGLGMAGTGRRWVQALAQLGHPRVRRLVITHYHPDHIGASTRLAEITGAEEIVQGRRDRELTVHTWLDPESGPRFQRYLVAHGMPAELADRSVGDEEAVPLLPVEPTRLVDEGDTLDLAGEPFEVLVLPGHADGHIALLGGHTGRLFGGDVLLDEITPNVGRWEDNEPDPLGRYLETLGRIEELAPAVVYPGHRGVVERPAVRAQEIARHHAVRLDEHEEALREGARSAYDVAQIAWGGTLGFHEQRFALAEALAHIERLERMGRAVEIAPNRWRAA
jgi:glyoxylase-like metal-dependent hydrolase (beta-lactamase superfamily II)